MRSRKSSSAFALAVLRDKLDRVLKVRYHHKKIKRVRR